MNGNSIGRRLILTSFGESHGKCIGTILDGCPAGLDLTEKDIQKMLDLRKPGQSLVSTQRKEDGMILKKGDLINGVELNAHDDHRLFMAFSIVGMLIGDCTVTDPDSASVSYPDFISDMQNCGARMSIV